MTATDLTITERGATGSRSDLVPCPAGEECEFLKRSWLCPVEDDPRTPREAHDFLLGLETTEPALAAQFVAAVIADTSTGDGPQLNLSLLTKDPGDFRWFVRVHNWQDPRLMASIAGLVEMAMEGRLRALRAAS